MLLSCLEWLERRILGMAVFLLCYAGIRNCIWQKLADMNLKIRFCNLAKFHDVARSTFLKRSPIASSFHDNWILRILNPCLIFDIKSESLAPAWWNLQNKPRSNVSWNTQNISHLCWICLELLTLQVRNVFF